MSKYEDLSRLQTLKDSGSLTEAEYEVEKYKILNSTDKQNNKTEGIYIASLVLGICSLLFASVPILGLILSIVSIVIWKKSKRRLDSNNATSGLVTAGLVLSIIALVIASLMTIIIVIPTIGLYIYNSSSVVPY